MALVAHLLHLHVAVGMVSKGLWTRWYQFVREHPEAAFKPRRIPESLSGLEVIAIAAGPPDFPDFYVLHPWRVPKDNPEKCALQPGPYLMAVTLEEARQLLPKNATLLEDVELVSIYREAYLV